MKIGDINEVSKGIFLKGDKILILKITGEFKYDLPGGKLKFGESREQGLFRECLEETNLKIKKAELIGRNEKRQKNYFSIIDWAGEIKLQLEEVEKYRWIKLNNALEYNLTRTAREGINIALKKITTIYSV